MFRPYWLQRSDYILLYETVIYISANFIPLHNLWCLNDRRHTSLQAEYTIRRLYATYVIQATNSTLQPHQVGYILHRF